MATTHMTAHSILERNHRRMGATSAKAGADKAPAEASEQAPDSKSAAKARPKSKAKNTKDSAKS
jgi:hypothetical protein